ncbi:MAG: thymidylate synthase (FAD) [Candidatus Latescibacteria bacterium]|nr:thymidylate synthase (FAD) [bacterium]MBD3424925.1 thymidylate synthase (FAD) [Candidatus Latescibacterota bacterium]
MKVRLAGYNIDSELMGEISGEMDSLTPEVISASYARISRDPRDISILRSEARDQVEKARSSNETIVFGLGHSSVAEHAVFNFDIMDISRLAVESLEGFRLAAYTEKSQRYIRIGRDFIIPAEVTENGLGDQFSKMMAFLADQYQELYGRMIDNGLGKSVAREDARYLLPLATRAQLGMTVNARELEYMVSRLASHRLSELRKLAGILTDKSSRIAPSLIKYPEASRYFSNRFIAGGRISEMAGKEKIRAESEVKLVSAPEDCDRLLAAVLLFSSGASGIEDSAERVEGLSREKVGEIIRMTLEGIQPHDSVWREFEFIEFIFEADLSASCFAQMKRHRMATITAQRYIPEGPVKIPRSASGCEDIFEQAAGKAERMYKLIEREAGIEAAEYALLNAHRRRVMIGMNLRELYHFSRLRSDSHAQWEIRELSENICSLVRKEAPLSSVLLGGKDSFESLIDRMDS